MRSVGYIPTYGERNYALPVRKELNNKNIFFKEFFIKFLFNIFMDNL